MHPLMQQRRDVLEGLRQRSTFVASAVPTHRNSSVDAVLAPLALTGGAVFQVLPQGGNVFHVIERVTGKLVGTRVGHVNACRYATELENTALANAQLEGDAGEPLNTTAIPSRDRASVEQRVRVAVVTLALGVLLAGATLYS